MHHSALIRIALVAVCLGLPIAAHAQPAPGLPPGGPQAMDFANGMSAMLAEGQTRETILNAKLALAQTQHQADAATLATSQDKLAQAQAQHQADAATITASQDKLAQATAQHAADAATITDLQVKLAQMTQTSTAPTPSSDPDAR